MDTSDELKKRLEKQNQKLAEAKKKKRWLEARIKQEDDARIENFKFMLGSYMSERYSLMSGIDKSDSLENQLLENFVEVCKRFENPTKNALTEFLKSLKEKKSQKFFNVSNAYEVVLRRLDPPPDGPDTSNIDNPDTGGGA